MGFFSKKNKNNKSQTAESALKVEQELIVHNMPSQQRISGEIASSGVKTPLGVSGSFSGEKGLGSNLGLKSGASSTNAIKSGNSFAPEKKSFKMVGILIIFFGLIVIGLIVFLIYRFVIAPTANNENKTPVKTEDLTQETKPIEKTPEPEILEPVVEINDNSSNIEAVVQETSENQPDEELMQEEFQGQDAENLPPLVDTDGDGLYDEEEILLGSSIFLKDSDEDGYEDLSELKNNYNPAGTGILAESPFIKIYRNFVYGFNFLYPSVWEANEFSDKLITFEDKDSSIIQLSIMENTDNSSILNWYQNSFPGEEIAYDKLISKTGYEGVVSQDNLNVYLTDESRRMIFVFTYIPASSERLSLINIFEMIYSSFNLNF